MKPVQKPIHLLATAATIALLAAATTPASAQDILHDNDFEDGTMGPWVAAGSAGDAGLYENGDVVVNMGSGDSEINWAPNGDFSLYVGRGDGYVELADTLPLASRGYTSVTISFNYTCRNPSSTRRLHTRYSSDNGETWDSLGFVTGSTGSGSYTINPSGHDFTDEALFRFTFSDSGGAAGPFFVDDVVISASPEFSGQFWDTNGATAGAGGPEPDGTWGVDDFWSNSPEGDEATGGWTPGELAMFSAGSDATGEYTVTVDGTQEIGGISFTDGIPTLTGGTLRMTSDSSFFVGLGLTATIASAVEDDENDELFTKTGLGTLVLSGDNSAALGGMALNAGVTQFENADAINGTARNITINSPAVLAFGPSFGAANFQTAMEERVAVSSDGTIAADNHEDEDFDFDTAGLTAASLGAFGTVNYTGTLTPNDGTYRLGGGGGTLRLNSAYDPVVIHGPGTIQFNGNDATVSGITGSGYILENANATTPMTLTINNSSGEIISETIRDGAGSEPLSLVKTGNGTLMFDATPPEFTGSVTLNAGRLRLYGDGITSLGGAGSTISVTGSSELEWRNRSYTLDNNLHLEDNVTLLAYTGQNNRLMTITGVVSGGNTSTLIVGDSGNLAQRRIILPNPNNTFTGTINLNDDGRRAALYTASLGDAEGAGNIIMRGQDESRFDLDSSAQSPMTFNHRQFEIAASGTTQGYASIRNMSTASSHANTFTINTDLLVSSSAGSKEIRLGGANTGANTFAGSIPDGDGASGTVISVRKEDAGRWILAGTNTYTGATTVDAGSLEIGGSGTLGHVSAGVGDYAGDISISSSSSGRLIYNSDSDQTLSGVISGEGQLFVEDGILTLTNDNTYTGTTTVNNGTLALVGGSQDTAITVNDGGSLGFTLGSPTESNKAVTLNSGHSIVITGTVDDSSDYLLMTADEFTGEAPELDTPITDYELELREGDAELWLTFTGTSGSLYDDWAATFLPDDVSDPTADFDSDGLTNLQEFAFGTDPTTSTGSITLDANGDVVNGRGRPIAYLAGMTEDTVDFRAIFSRRKDFEAAGLVYTVQFSTELDEWVDYEFDTGEPILLDGSDSEIDVVYVPFPLAIETSNGFEKPHFVRIGVAFEDDES